MGLISIRRSAYTLLLLLISLLPVVASGETGAIKIIAGGDLMLGSWIQETVQTEGWDYPFREIDTVLADADIVFANLEAPFGTDGSAFEKAYTFRVKPSLVNVLTAGKINMVSLANNHILDFGEDVLRQTRTILSEKGIHFSGAGKNLSEARQPVIFTVGGKKIAWACYSLTFPEEFWASDSSAGTCFPWEAFFFDDIRRFKRENDLVVVSFHWGSELMTSPKDYQVLLAHQTIECGADLILGHHPHVLQGLEIYKDKLIAYSLGNFVFGSYSENVKESMLLKIAFQSGGNWRCKIIPLNVYNKEVKFQPRFLRDGKREDFFGNLRELSLELNNQRDVIGKGDWIKEK